MSRKQLRNGCCQFGEGNFLRAFVDYFLDVANEEGSFDGKVVLVQPIEMGLTNLVNSQDGLYHPLPAGQRARPEGR